MTILFILIALLLYIKWTISYWEYGNDTFRFAQRRNEELVSDLNIRISLLLDVIRFNREDNPFNVKYGDTLSALSSELLYINSNDTSRVMEISDAVSLIENDIYNMK